MSTSYVDSESLVDMERHSMNFPGTAIHQYYYQVRNPSSICVFWKMCWCEKCRHFWCLCTNSIWHTKHNKKTFYNLPLLTSRLYSSNSPLNGIIVWLRMVHNSLHTRLIKNWSWDTTTTPPWNLFKAFANASIVSTLYLITTLKPISKWFVGSSITRMCGLVFVINAKETRVFWPPLSVFTDRSAISMVHLFLPTQPSLTPKRANWLRRTCSSSFG